MNASLGPQADSPLVRQQIIVRAQEARADIQMIRNCALPGTPVYELANTANYAITDLIDQLAQS